MSVFPERVVGAGCPRLGLPRPVVGHEHDDGVVHLPRPRQLRHHAAHRRVHLAQLPPLGGAAALAVRAVRLREEAQVEEQRPAGVLLLASAEDARHTCGREQPIEIFTYPLFTRVPLTSILSERNYNSFPLQFFSAKAFILNRNYKGNPVQQFPKKVSMSKLRNSNLQFRDS